MLIAALVLVIIIVIIIVLMRRKKKDEDDEPRKRTRASEPEEPAQSGPAGPVDQGMPDIAITPVADVLPELPEGIYQDSIPVPDSSPYSAIAQTQGAPGDLTAPAIPPISQDPLMLPPAATSPQPAGAKAPQSAKTQTPQPGMAQTPQTAQPTTPEDKRKTFDDIFSGI